MRFTLLVGARPNFMKAAPILREVAGRSDVSAELVHTGQHYDAKMSDVFFQQLGLPAPDVHLGVGSGSHAEQTAAVMVKLEKHLADKSASERPDWLVVVGDVNSTMAGAVAAAKLHVKVAHVEAGLRSFDREMPEEINRLVTDAIADKLLTTEEAANANLRREGHPEGRIAFVGNVMIDTLRQCLGAADSVDLRALLAGRPASGVGLRASGTAVTGAEAMSTAPGVVSSSPNSARSEGRSPGRDVAPLPPYALMTMHRPGNVDDRDALAGLVGAIEEIAREIRVVFPAHPRTIKRLDEFGLRARMESATRMIDPVGYIEMLALQRGARMVLTDSGGMQEETTVLGVPCLTMRANTERPCTVEIGTSELVGSDPARIVDAARRVLAGRWKRGTVPPLWDGHAAARIIEALTA